MRPLIKGSDLKGKASASSAAFIPVSRQKAWPRGCVAGAPLCLCRLWGGRCAVRPGLNLRASEVGLQGQAAEIGHPWPWGSDYSSRFTLDEASTVLVLCVLTDLPHSLTRSPTHNVRPTLLFFPPQGLIQGMILTRCAIQVHYQIN